MIVNTASAPVKKPLKTSIVVHYLHGRKRKIVAGEYSGAKHNMYATLDEAYKTTFDEPRHGGKRRSARPASPAAPVKEEFTDLSTAPKDSYTGRLNDYTFGCKQYGVCPKTLKEGFTSGDRPAARGPPLTKTQTKCAPLSPPNYEYPLNEQDKQKFGRAMEAALSEGYEGQPPVEQKTSRMVDMAKVDGYADDDLDQYLPLDSFKDQITLSPLAQPPKGAVATPYDPRSSPFADLLREASRRRKQELPSPLVEEVVVGVRPPMWMDLLLFVLIGVLVILIMDQLFRLAMVAGMKQTLEVMRPFLENVTALKEALEQP